MKVVFLQPVSSLDGSYAAKESHDLPELLARQWEKLGYCSIVNEVSADTVVTKEPVTVTETEQPVRQTRVKATRTRTKSTDTA